MIYHYLVYIYLDSSFINILSVPKRKSKMRMNIFTGEKLVLLICV